MSLPPIVPHRTVHVVTNQNTRKGVVTKTECTTCGFTTEDEQERREHYPRYLVAEALRIAAKRLLDESSGIASNGILLTWADETEARA